MVSSKDVMILGVGGSLGLHEQLSGQECPFCNSGEKSFSITREATGIVYKCHRNKCGINGFVRTAGGGESRPAVEGKSKVGVWIRAATPLMEAHKDWLYNHWKLEDRHIRKGGIEFSLANQRLMLPIYNAEGTAVGASFRTIREYTPKSIICMTDIEALCLSFYKNGDSRVGIIVEDQASALRASMYCNSVALLGVHMDALRATQIARQGWERVIFCLDKDAFSKNIELSQKWGSMMKKYVTVCPPKDLKDMTEVELQGFMKDSCGITIEGTKDV